MDCFRLKRNGDAADSGGTVLSAPAASHRFHRFHEHDQANTNEQQSGWRCSKHRRDLSSCEKVWPSCRGRQIRTVQTGTSTQAACSYWREIPEPDTPTAPRSAHNRPPGPDVSHVLKCRDANRQAEAASWTSMSGNGQVPPPAYTPWWLVGVLAMQRLGRINPLLGTPRSHLRLDWRRRSAPFRSLNGVTYAPDGLQPVRHLGALPHLALSQVEIARRDAVAGLDLVIEDRQLLDQEFRAAWCRCGRSMPCGHWVWTCALAVDRLAAVCGVGSSEGLRAVAIGAQRLAGKKLGGCGLAACRPGGCDRPRRRTARRSPAPTGLSACARQSWKSLRTSAEWPKRSTGIHAHRALVRRSARPPRWHLHEPGPC